VTTTRRVFALPSALRRCEISGAVVRDGLLSVRFESRSGGRDYLTSDEEP